MNCFVAIDFETAKHSRDTACAVGVVRVENSRITRKEYRLINPKTYFLKYFTENCHGLSEDDVKDSPEFDVVWQELLPMLEGTDFIAAHNAKFDKDVLHLCCKKYNLTPPEQRFVCSYEISKKLWKLPSSKLNRVCEHLKIPLNHHHALSDANGCAEIMIRAMQEGYVV